MGIKTLGEAGMAGVGAISLTAMARLVQGKLYCNVYVFRATYLKGSNVKIARACDYFYTVLSLNLLIISLTWEKELLTKNDGGKYLFKDKI